MHEEGVSCEVIMTVLHAGVNLTTVTRFRVVCMGGVSAVNALSKNEAHNKRMVKLRANVYQGSRWPSRSNR